MDPRTKHMLTAAPLPLLARMATPSTLAFFVQGIVSLAEVWFIGQLGSISLAAIALSFPLLMLTQTLSGGAIGGAVASAIARALGAADVARAESLVWHALAIAIMGALVLFAIFLMGGEAFITLLGGRGEVLEQSYSYALVLLSGGVFIWMLGITSAIFRGMGNMQYPALAIMLGSIFQIPLSGCLILGVYGLPKLGIVGAAVSAVISGLLVSIVMLRRLSKGDGIIRLRLSAMSFSKANFRDILQVALPASLSPILTIATVLMLTAFVGRFGEAALAGYGIGSRIEFLIIPLVFGLGSSMTSLVGMGIGAGDIHRAERVGWIGGLCAGVIAGVVGIVLAIFPDGWISLFTQDSLVHTSAKSFIQIAGPCFFFQGLGLSLYFASQGANAMRWPVLATILRVAVAGCVSYSLGFIFDVGLTGIYYGAALGMVSYAIIIAGALKFGAWRPSIK